jgi:NAD(P)-dependent dehydrogenase (short-subunit alcohol dehydrogenase family)
MRVETDEKTGLSGARVLVTGGTRGIGAATVRRLASAGARVVAAARTVPEATVPEATVPAWPDGGSCRFVAADAGTADGVAALAAQALDLLGGIDILVSNAGSQTHRPEGILAFSDEDWQRDLDLNLLSAVRLDRALLPTMIAQGRGGAIIHVGSNAARMPRPASLPYTAAKAALTAYSKGLARQAGPHGVRVNMVLPGLIRTEALDTRMAALADQTGATADAVLENTIAALGIPLERAGTADDVAQLITFLASPAAAYLTGSQFTVDGGALPTL